MNLNQLKYFKTVCETGSVSGASEILHVSQPSLSLAIKELEIQFNVVLFKRHYKGMCLTKEGEELYKLSKGLLEYSTDVERYMMEIGGEKKTLRLGVPPMIGSILLPKIFKEYFSRFTDVVPDIVEAGTGELKKLLVDNRLDMAIISHNKPIDENFLVQEITSFEVVCCVNASSPLSQKKVVTVNDLKNYPLVLFEDGFFQTEEIKKWFANSSETPKVLFQTNQLSTLQNLIKSGVAIGFMFKELIENDDKLKAIPTDTPIKLSVGLVWCNQARKFGAMQSFLDYVKSISV